MLVLALDTATPVVTAGLVELPAAGPAVPLASRAHEGRRHGELLMPAVRAVCAEAGRRLSSVDAVVVGAGPGPFTGLRVGIASAAALGHALDVGVHGVCSHDAMAHSRSAGGTRVGGGNVLVVTDARRREVYWAAYDPDARRLTGPTVEPPAALAARLDELAISTVVGDPAFAEQLGVQITGPGSPTPAWPTGSPSSPVTAARCWPGGRTRAWTCCSSTPSAPSTRRGGRTRCGCCARAGCSWSTTRSRTPRRSRRWPRCSTPSRACTP